MRSFIQFTGMLLYAIGPMAFAAGGAGGGDEGIANSQSEQFVKDPVIRAAKDGIAKQDWVRTQELLKKAIASNPNNADYHNLYAFTTRKGPNPNMNLVFSEYALALKIDPKHLGAHEYLGEAYLQTNDLAKAKEQLAALDKLCVYGCEEYSDLKRSVKEYEANHPK
jgi:Tfp pilus assembly protein PilF